MEKQWHITMILELCAALALIPLRVGRAEQKMKKICVNDCQLKGGGYPPQQSYPHQQNYPPQQQYPPYGGEQPPPYPGPPGMLNFTHQAKNKLNTYLICKSFKGPKEAIHHFSAF